MLWTWLLASFLTTGNFWQTFGHYFIISLWTPISRSYIKILNIGPNSHPWRICSLYLCILRMAHLTRPSFVVSRPSFAVSKLVPWPLLLPNCLLPPPELCYNSRFSLAFRMEYYKGLLKCNRLYPPACLPMCLFIPL